MYAYMHCVVITRSSAHIQKSELKHTLTHRVELFGVLDEQFDVGGQLTEVIVLVRVQVHLDLGHVDRVLNRLPGASQRPVNRLGGDAGRLGF